MRAFSKELNIDQDFLYVGDSALYSGAVKNGQEMKWFSRVSENITETKYTLQRSEESLEWLELDDAIKYKHLTSVRRSRSALIHYRFKSSL